MKEREPQKETVTRGDLLFLGHPGTDDIFSGYGLTVHPEDRHCLVGLLMVDRPQPVNPEWLREVEETFGEAQLVAMTATGERGILCQMHIEPASQSYLRSLSFGREEPIRAALKPLLEEPPAPSFTLRWDEEVRVWRSRLDTPWELPLHLRELFKETGYGSLAVKTNSDVVHICHASDADIESFRGKPVLIQWQYIRMPMAPLIRLEMNILDNPANPYRFESFLNVADEDQATILAQLANQDQLYLAFYGDNLNHRYTIGIKHSEQQWQQLDEIVAEACRHWQSIPPQQRNYDQAKAEFMRHHF